MNDQDIFKSLNNKYALPEINNPTAQIQDQIKNKIDAMLGDYEHENVDSDATKATLEDVFVAERGDRDEFSEDFSELEYTVEELIKFIKTGSREKLLKYFTEEQLDQAGFFDDALKQLENFISFSKEMRSTLEGTSPIHLAMIYNVIRHFEASLGSLLVNSLGNRNILNEVILDESRFESKEEDPTVAKLKKISKDLSSVGAELFDRTIDLDNEEELGEETYNFIFPFAAAIRSHIQIIQSITLEDLAYLNIDQTQKENILKRIKMDAQSLLGNIEKLIDPANKESILREKKKESTIRNIMLETFSSGMSAGLVNRLFSLIPKDEGELF